MYYGPMATLTFRISDELAARFAARARALGGKSTLLRGLVEQAIDQDGASPAPRGAAEAAPLAPGASGKVTLRLRGNEMALLTEAARRRGMSRTQWVTSLVRARLGFGLQQTADERNELRAIARELNRIGGNLNQVARAANTQVLEGRQISIDLEVIRHTAAAVAAAMSELRTLAARSAGYWSAE